MPRPVRAPGVQPYRGLNREDQKIRRQKEVKTIKSLNKQQAEIVRQIPYARSEQHILKQISKESIP